MNEQPQDLTDTNAFGCFEINVDDSLIVPSWVDSWREQIVTEKLKVSSSHNEALARLMPFLLCGEQSAIQVFGAEIERIRDTSWSKSIDLLKSIESDEYGHEKALRTLSSLLMQPTDLNDIKRQARHFFLKLGKTTGMAEHFARVAQLDACVCIIMNEIANSDLGKSNLVTQLVVKIKKDEARHVGVSKKHYHYLGGDESMLKQNKHDITLELVELLHTQADSFENLGIDTDRMFRKLTNTRNPVNSKQFLIASQ